MSNQPSLNNRRSIFIKNSLLFFVLFGEEEKKEKFPSKLSSSLHNEEISVKEEEGKRNRPFVAKKKKKRGRKKEPGKKSGKGKAILFPSKRLISTRLWRGCEKFRIAPSSFHELAHLVQASGRSTSTPPLFHL